MSSLSKRLSRHIIFISLLVLLLSTVLIIALLHDVHNENQLEHLDTEVNILSSGVELNGLDYLSTLPPSSTRITWIAPDGSVQFDSEFHPEFHPKFLPNQLVNAEVQEALSTGFGRSERHALESDETTLFAARRLRDGSVIRAATNRYSTSAILSMIFYPVVLMVLVVLPLAILLSGSIARKLVRPLNELNLVDPLSNETYEELAPLLRHVGAQNIQLDEQLASLQRAREEFCVVTASMSEGLILLNNENHILSINHAAAKFLETNQSAVGADILSLNRSATLRELLRRAHLGKRAEQHVSDDEYSLQIVASPVTSRRKVVGVALLFLDTTAYLLAEQRRREFTANVSHELKTPLHSIAGCAEILKTGVVKPEDAPQFIEQIYSEAQRMMTLIEDIIRLSQLDENREPLPRVSIDLLQHVETTLARLRTYASERGITLCCRGDNAILQGIPRNINDIIYNLCDNAIKYNRTGGRVDVTVTQNEHDILLTVSDTGIGIPMPDRRRIFERFYRVDKSHSKEIGGTGLGLSIVKHAALTHGASYEVDSKEGQGTTISIRFPI